MITKNDKGKSQINKAEAFVELNNGEIPDSEESITTLLGAMDEEVKKLDPKITREALSNAHGDWYEWLLAIAAWNVFVSHESADLAILLPNVRQFDVAKLYKPELSNFIEDLREKVSETADVQLVTSNPDFVILKREVANRIITDQTKITHFNIEKIRELSSRYSAFVESCDFTQILGFVSVKTSFRPDRRLQIAHEGSLMKAIYIHLQTRKWEINPPGLKYYAIATKMTDSDRNALRTVATHSIITVSSLPEAAVDEVFEVNSIQQALDAFQRILVR